MSDIKKLTLQAFQVNAQDWCKQIENFISDRFRQSYRDGIVVPISGGLDSSVVAALCTRAIGNEKVYGLMLPETLGNPDADYFGHLIAKHLDIKTMKINISPILRALGTSNLFLSAISGREFWKPIVDWSLRKKKQSANILYLDALKGQLDPSSRKLIAQVNSKQRARLLATYKIADDYNLMVAGSSHKTEQMVGLFVKFGIDDCADIMPLKNVYRSQTLQLAEYMEIPGEILHRSPNPDILPGITDKYQGYFGMDYQKVELILLGMQMELNADEIARQLELEDQTVIQMLDIVNLSENFRSHALAPELK